jgi:hypothetical protein
VAQADGCDPVPNRFEDRRLGGSEFIFRRGQSSCFAETGRVLTLKIIWSSAVEVRFATHQWHVRGISGL